MDASRQLIESKVRSNTAVGYPRNRRGLYKIPFLSMSLLIAALAVGSAPASAAGGTTAAVPPAKRPVAVFGTQTSGPTQLDNRGYFDFGATPGGVIMDHIAILNYSIQPLQLLIRGADAVNTPQGGFALLPPNEKSTQVGVWVVLRPGGTRITVPPRSRAILPFEVIVPQNATPGDHAGGITATLVGLVKSNSGQELKLLQSVGTRLFIRVSGQLKPRLAVHNLSVRYDEPINPLSAGTAVLTYVVSNVGNVALGGRPSAWVSGLFGSKERATKLPDIQVLLPGFSATETARVNGVYPEFLESVHVSVTRLVVPGSVQPLSGPFTATKRFWAVPWILVALVILALAGSAWFWRRRRRKGRARVDGVPPGMKPSKEPTFTTAAEVEPVSAPTSQQSPDSVQETTQ